MMISSAGCHDCSKSAERIIDKNSHCRASNHCYLSLLDSPSFTLACKLVNLRSWGEQTAFQSRPPCVTNETSAMRAETSPAPLPVWPLDSRSLGIFQNVSAQEGETDKRCIWWIDVVLVSEFLNVLALQNLTHQKATKHEQICAY